MDITYQYTKLRGDFGQQPQFAMAGPELCDNITVDPNLHKAFILRNPVHTSVQHGPIFSQREINTIRAEYTTSGCNHAEGGWPKDVNIYDPEATERYRRKVQKDDYYINCINNTAAPMEKLILQNNAIDMYEKFFTTMRPQEEVVHFSCRTVNVYRDTITTPFKRKVSSICWRPDGGPNFAVTYNNVDFDRKPVAPITCYIWDVENANKPEIEFTPPTVLLDLQYNEKDLWMLAGGLINGQVVGFDNRNMRRPVFMCPPHVAHRDLVTGVKFINSKSGKEFFSGSPDGTCKWWDVRNISEPIDVIMIDVVPNTNVKQIMPNTDGISCLEFEPTIPTRFMVGTENGYVISGNRKGKTAVDMLPAKLAAHLGPVWKVERNPGFLKNFLTVGDWTMRIWSEECRESAVIWSPPQRFKITDGAWSPTRLSLMLLTHSDGIIALWDILRCQYEPVLKMQVCAEPLVKVKPHEGGAMVACGNSVGNIFMVELSRSLTESGAQDKGRLTSIFDREAKRERILEARMREIKVKQRAMEEAPEAKVSLTSMPDAIGDKDLAEAASEYFQVIKKELAAL